MKAKSLLEKFMLEKNMTIYRKDYIPSPFLVKSIHLTFRLSPKNTHVIARIMFSPVKGKTDLYLDGIDLKLIKVSINGSAQSLDYLTFQPEGLIVPKSMVPKTDFIWEAETIISPETNTSLEGLYRSSGTYCTQCEAQGFRKITYFLDRPDIMTTYTVRIEGEEPVMLSNGNLCQIGNGFTEWHDPWPKPSYLFALVAGNLISFNDTFITKSGRKIELKIYVKPNDIDKCSYAMNALKRSMAWDENEYQREYDLELFMIVAIDDFNMGAMENKGLNIFNSQYVLADPKTATDQDYDNIERIIAHEYFHNWTGNRITCRDWFQLCLKEGLTVFRDQQFSAEMRGFTTKRIEDVLTLQNQQFTEDDGPLAHPVRPDQYVEINNFYTATVYEKGAEVVRMLKLFVGDALYSQALQRYFSTFDGKACTIEDWLDIFEKTTKINLKQFSLWYSQKGRPKVEVSALYEHGTFTMEFSQKLDSGEQQEFKPMVIPIIIGLLDENGAEIHGSKTFFLTQKKQIIRFDNLPSKPIPSTLRDFSAPVTLIEKITDNDLYILARYDQNLFNRWSALRKLSFRAIEKWVYNDEPISSELLSSIEMVLSSDDLCHAYRALVATPPTTHNILNYFSSQHRPIDPSKIHAAIEFFNLSLARKCNDFISEFFNNYMPSPIYKPDTKQTGIRAFAFTLMNLFCNSCDGIKTTRNSYSAATNMTDEMNALTLLVRHNTISNELDHFFEKWKYNNNVIDKWFATQARNTHPEKSFMVVSNLTKHPSFNFKNPNRFRSLIGAFAAGNLAGFHQNDGKSYELVTNWLIKLDRINPQTTARVCTVFDNWRLFDTDRQLKMKKNLLRLSNIPKVSKNTLEIVDSILNK